MNIPTFPARPINGGPLDRARPKNGDWWAEPKYNGWRVLVHAPSRACWNREGKPLSIESAFADSLLKLAEVADATDIAWFDCEGLERRHKIGQGSLVVLDAIILPGRPIYSERRRMLEAAIPLHRWDESIPANSLRLVDTKDSAIAPELWEKLKGFNADHGAEFYEGIVMKRLTSHYPIQIRSPREEFAGWMKHRWEF